MNLTHYIQNVFYITSADKLRYFVRLLQALLVASDLWDVPAVHEACCRYMKSLIDMKNCVGIYCFAEDASCETLRKFSMDYILDHFSGIYQQVSQQGIIYLLRSLVICVFYFNIVLLLLLLLKPVTSN